MPAASSWGREWLQRTLGQSQDRMDVAAAARGGGADAADGAGAPGRASLGSLEDRALRQAGRELMLAQASDWPFIITNGTTEQYARRRFHDHINRFHDLLYGLERQRDRPDELASAGIHGCDLPGAGLPAVRVPSKTPYAAECPFHFLLSPFASSMGFRLQPSAARSRGIPPKPSFRRHGVCNTKK